MTMIAAIPMGGWDPNRPLWQQLRERVRLRTRLRKGARRLRAALARLRATPARLLAHPRLRTWRARLQGRRLRRRVAGLDDLASAPSGRDLDPALDVRGVLRASADAGPGSVDVVICVRDALEDVHRCLASVLEASGRALRLIVVDDGSGEATTRYLGRFAAANPAVDLRRNPGPTHGYTVAANIGLRASAAEHVVLLNSDTIVTRGWLDRLVAAASADGVGIVGPLSNAATHQSVPAHRVGGEWAVNELPEWLTADGMAALLAELPCEDAIPVPFLNGFCYCIKRPVIEAIGHFDEERFAEGYSEENDFSRRAADAGFALAVATRAYVAHAKSRSYGHQGRKELAKRNYRRFLAKHGEDRIQALVAELEGDAALAAVRERVGEAIASPRDVATRLPRFRVTFVLPGLARGGSGGSHSVYQEVAAMRSLGLQARIAVHDRARDRVAETYPDSDELFITYGGDDELVSLLDGDDVAVATHFKSAASVARIVAGGAVALGAYYVQDYEPFLVSPDSPDTVEASESYRLIPGGLLFAKTDWIRDTLFEREGVAVAKVEPSIDRDLFFASGRSEGDGSVHIVAMLRPRTPRRAPRETLDVLVQVAKRYGSDVRITTFGCDPGELATLGAVPAAIDHRGLLSRRSVADLLRTADIFLDCSWYQAFGRTSLEAMACGATAVLPEIGGVGEFAEHEVNSLLVDTRSRQRTYAAVARLLEDRDLLRRLQSAAQETAARYSSARAALSEYSLFCHVLASRRRADDAAAARRPSLRHSSQPPLRWGKDEVPVRTAVQPRRPSPRPPTSPRRAAD